ncbi:coproporphyrinogen dehydrogenase HemZ [Clostridium tetani]|uniref:Coproporphyrinogen dehydrogenase HemZ n=1 Tax=Clostridium tetani TaxID=1513 RepID=A0A4Q0VD96_CLOTA|nr:coproporphyrinogen dehydrogenase HemZ [Clostridium tetani]
MIINIKLDIKLNHAKYRYGIYQLFNIFFPNTEINFVDGEEANYTISVEDDYINIKGINNNKKYLIDESIPKKDNVKKSIYLYLKDETKKSFPWGTLIGIRPSKIALSLLSENKSFKDILDYLNKNYLTSKKKAQLCIDVARREETFVNKSDKSISIYIGMPFCPTRCLYCSFTSNPIGKNKKLVEEYIKCLSFEIEEIKKYIDKKDLTIETVYFGGGTPTSVDNHEFEYIMEKIYNNFICNRNVKEFTVECGRPDSINKEKFKIMKKYDTTRISINPQSMNNDTLKVIGRSHTVEDVIRSFNEARELGFYNINMDIIVGLPGEGLSHIENTYKKILKLKPDSLTVHGMSIKRGSTLYHRLEKVLNSDQNELNEIFERTSDLAEELNMKPYYMYRQKNMLGNAENVGYSIKGKECIYNIQMIEERQTIIALGADGVSKIVFRDENRIKRVPNVKDVIEYNKRVEEMVKRKVHALEELY